ncbi:MAG: general secretion pathway protein GspD [Burkholderiales bacterium]|nr:general secretion pathway protein GspD [Burkholderiales bacterium]
MTRPIHAACAVIALLVCLLGGCAAERSYRDAQTLLEANRTEEALAAYRQALQSEPTNARYRIGYLSARDKAVARWIDDAERLRRSGDKPAETRALYARVLSVDEANSRARAGLADLDRDQYIADSMSRAGADARQGNTDLALTQLRAVLAERPQHAAALALRTQVLEQRAKPKANVDAKLAEAFRRPVSLEFRDAQLKQVFEVLSRSSGLNFVLDKEVRGDQRTTLFLRNTTISDAVALALLTNQLEQRVLDASTILIFPNTPAKVREYQQLTVKSFVLSTADAKTVANSLKTILKVKDVVIDEKQNMIVMRDSPEAIQMAEKLVTLHDQPEAEVMLDVEILEIKRSRLLQAGVQYPTQVALAPMTSASGVQLTLGDLKNLRAATTSVTGVGIGLQATSTVSDVNVLANPRIRSRNREKAKIQVGQRVPNITSTSTSTGFVAESVQYVDVGLKLEVEPSVSPDGEVAIKIALEVSNILSQIQTKGGSIAYEIGTRNANTVLRLRDGENQVLAGLINDEDRRSVTGLPGLSSIPAVGGTLFGNTQDDYQKSEIVLSITPRIVRSAFRPDLAMSEFESGTEANLRSRGAEFSSPAATPSTTTGAGRTAPSAGQSVPPAAPAVDEPRSESSPAVSPTMPPSPNVGSSEVPLPSEPATAATTTGAAPADTVAPSTPEQPTASSQSSLSWRGGNSVAVGGTVTVELWAAAAQPLSVVPLSMSYDPRVLSIVSVDQGSFMANAGTASAISKRAETGSGVIRVVLTAAGGVGKAAEGSMVRLVFKALSASDSTSIAVTESVSGVTPTGEALVLASPPEWLIRVK